MKKEFLSSFFSKTLKKGFVLFCVFSFLPFSSAEFLSDLGTIKGETAEKDPEIPQIQLPTPKIFEIHIEESRELDKARVIIHGENLMTPDAKTEISFPLKNGSEVAGQIANVSPTLITANLPKDAGSGNITVKLRGKNENFLDATSPPFFFEFQVPEILFVTAEDGFGSGKKIQIWGRNFEGISFRQNGKSMVDNSRQSATLKGISTKVTQKFSVFETILPSENFFQDFWVERNCASDGSNCLVSNKVSLSHAVPPILTNWQADWSSREMTLFGKNFPDTDTKNITFFLEGKTLKLLEYNHENNSAKVALPCPLPAWGEVKMKLSAAKTTIESNPLLFEARDTPQILEMTLRAGNRVGYTDIVLGADDDLEIPDSPNCSDKNYKNALLIGSKRFSLQKQGGSWVSANNLSSTIPSSGVATLYLSGVSSPEFAFSQADMEADPLIFRIESKYGFRPGGIFSIFGINLGNQYLACGIGKTSIIGPKVLFEEKDSENKCRRIAPEVTNTQIRAQFVSLVSGQYFSEQGVSEVLVSVKVGNKTSNTISIPFNDPNIKIAEAPPVISRLLFPSGHLSGDVIKIMGVGFGTSAKSNLVNFGEIAVFPESARETQLTVKIPEGVQAQTLTVTRRGSIDQVSEEYPIKIAGGSDRLLEFAFLPLDEKEPREIDVSSKPQSFVAAHLSVKNFIGDLSIRRFRLQMKWQDGDSQNPLSVATTKVFPMGSFSLSLNGKKISRPAVPVFENGNAVLNFPDFVLPLTTKESDELKLEGSLLRTVTDGSSFSFSFSPQKGSDFLAYNYEAEKGALSTNQSSVSAVEKFSVKNASATCLDLDESNIHCAEFLESSSSSAQKKSNSSVFTTNTKSSTISEKSTTSNMNPVSSAPKTKKTSSSEILAATIRGNFRDTDGDGLTDGEEKILGTDIKKKDTDGDGHLDFLEIEFGFDPKEKVSEAIFSDLSGKYTGSIARLGRMKVITGFSDGSFRPDDRISRGAFYAWLMALFGDGTGLSESQFSDMKRESSFFDAVVAAEKMKILVPTEKESFGAFNSVLRMEACESLLRAAGFSLSVSRGQKSSFSDIQGTANPWAEKCVQFDIFSPIDTEKKVFGVKTPISRGEFAEALLRTTRFFQEKK